MATDAGGWRLINRAGLPMVHPLFTHLNEDLGNRLNSGRPADDDRSFGGEIADMVAGMVTACGTADDPRAYAELVVAQILPNIAVLCLALRARGILTGNHPAQRDNRSIRTGPRFMVVPVPVIPPLTQVRGLRRPAATFGAGTPTLMRLDHTGSPAAWRVGGRCEC